MTKHEQEIINAKVEQAYDAAMDEYDKVPQYYSTRLRTCSACVITLPNWYILRSYATPIAAIHRATGICYDALRMVYGFTATSAQHIAKFAHDYGETERLTYR